MLIEKINNLNLALNKTGSITYEQDNILALMMMSRWSDHGESCGT